MLGSWLGSKLGSCVGGNESPSAKGEELSSGPAGSNEAKRDGTAEGRWLSVATVGIRLGISEIKRVVGSGLSVEAVGSRLGLLEISTDVGCILSLTRVGPILGRGEGAFEGDSVLPGFGTKTIVGIEDGEVLTLGLGAGVGFGVGLQKYHSLKVLKCLQILPRFDLLLLLELLPLEELESS